MYTMELGFSYNYMSNNKSVCSFYLSSAPIMVLKLQVSVLLCRVGVNDIR